MQIPPNLDTRRLISFRLPKGTNDESPVSNEEFLSSYCTNGVWLRAVNSSLYFRALQEILGESSSEGTSLASKNHLPVATHLCYAIGLYQELALQLEDAASMLVSLASWAIEPSANVADLLERVFIVSSSKPPGKLDPRPYHIAIAQDLAHTTRRIPLNLKQFAPSIVKEDGKGILRYLGLPWAEHVSTRVRPAEKKLEWNALPHFADELIDTLFQEKSSLVKEYHNKLKHGPQIVLTSVQTAIEHRGFTEVPHEMTSDLRVRLLLNGSQTDVPSSEHIAANGQDDHRIDSDQPAPFLYHEIDRLKNLIDHMLLPTANEMFAIAKWIYFRRFKDWPPEYDHSIAEIVVDPWLARRTAEGT